MIEGNRYIRVVEKYFNFLITEFDFRLCEKKIRGNFFYDVKYKNEVCVVSISYENMEDYLLVTIFILQNGEMPDYEDKIKTLHLDKLRAKILSGLDKNEIDLNNKYFLQFKSNEELERKLLKSAKELRLCLKNLKYLKSR